MKTPQVEEVALTHVTDKKVKELEVDNADSPSFLPRVLFAAIGISAATFIILTWKSDGFGLAEQVLAPYSPLRFGFGFIPFLTFGGAVFLLFMRSYRRMAPYARVQKLVEAGDELAAETELRVLLETPQHAAIASTQIATLLAKRGEWQGALDVIEQYLAVSGDQTRMAKLYWQARINIALQREQIVAVVLEQMCRDFPDAETTRIVHARWLRLNGRNEEAEEVVNKTMADFDNGCLLPKNWNRTHENLCRFMTMDFEEADAVLFRELFLPSTPDHQSF